MHETAARPVRPVAAIDHPVVRVLVADARDIERAGLCSMLAVEPDLLVVGESASIDHLTSLACAARPDVALVATGSPRLDGLAAIRAIKASDARIIAIAVLESEGQADRLVEVLESGASGFLLIDSDRSELISLVRQAACSGSAIPPELVTRLLDQMSGQGRVSRPDALTIREMQVLRQIALGDTNQEIARNLSVAVGTVKIHIEHILAKLNAPGRTAAAMRGVELGLIQPPDPSRDPSEVHSSRL